MTANEGDESIINTFSEKSLMKMVEEYFPNDSKIFSDYYHRHKYQEQIYFITRKLQDVKDMVEQLRVMTILDMSTKRRDRMGTRWIEPTGAAASSEIIFLYEVLRGEAITLLAKEHSSLKDFDRAVLANFLENLDSTVFPTVDEDVDKAFAIDPGSVRATATGLQRLVEEAVRGDSIETKVLTITSTPSALTNRCRILFREHGLIVD